MVAAHHRALLLPAARRLVMAACGLVLGASGVILSLPVSAETGKPAAWPPVVAAEQELPLTPSMTEGPYFKPDSPLRSSLIEEGVSGTPILLTGQVLAPDGQPIAGAVVDIWQADERGRYDTAGYRLRGHTLTDENGVYALETIVPGLYPGRTRHIHVKVQAPGGPVLTTQLFFPDEAANARDRIFDPRLLLEVQESEHGLVGRFTFVVAIA
ncbi:MAG: intradiol ring-cleavage dioxygenase [Chloroflexota bacterium]|nr:intradiol ring-cleavage dioxygenase [Dehalococcoidia bacterium]MDW8254776.1 intradiol ring-cleavage dioxygenase [Chloroflexota bacterium]